MNRTIEQVMFQNKGLDCSGVGCVSSQTAASVSTTELTPYSSCLYLQQLSLLEWAAVACQTATVCPILSEQKPLDPWSYKPWWCQPWSILLTGTMIIASSWALVKTVWVTVLVTLPILVWWTFFLLIWPGLFRESGRSDNY